MNLDHVLTPLAGTPPCGPDLSFSVEFDRLQELRREDDATIPRGELDAEHKRADWPAVKKLASALLAEQTKDLRLAAWWTEAAARLDGYAGLAEGASLYANLCQTFWDGVHPQPDSGDFDLRIGSITWLLGLVTEFARQLPVLQVGGQALSLAEWGSLRQRARGTDEEAAKSARDTLDRLQRGASGPALQQVLASARRIVDTLGELQALVDARLGADGPAFVAAREAMQDAVTGIERLATELGVGVAAAAHTPTESAPGNDTPASAQARPSCPARAPRPWPNCGWWPTTSAATSRTARWLTWPIAPPSGARCRCTCGCARC
jgi:type VI secretion system protein ImpA